MWISAVLNASWISIHIHPTDHPNIGRGLELSATYFVNFAIQHQMYMLHNNKPLTVIPGGGSQSATMNSAHPPFASPWSIDK